MEHVYYLSNAISSKERISLFPSSHSGGLTLGNVRRYRIISKKAFFPFLLPVFSLFMRVDPYSQPFEVKSANPWVPHCPASGRGREQLWV